MERFPRLVQWLILLLASLALGFGLQVFHVPAALLLGPMIVGVAMGLHDCPKPVSCHSYPIAC